MAEDGNKIVPDGSPAVPRLDDLAAVLPSRGGVVILPHDHPDPDAITSAAALHLLLERKFGVHSRIVFSGSVTRAENIELFKHFRYHWLSPDQIRVRPKRRIAALFVDTRPWSGNITVPRFARSVAVFDHHFAHRGPIDPGLFADLRPGLGATVSMLFEYLEAAGVAVPTWLATCMSYAIASETMDFKRRHMPLDERAYLSLIRRANLRVLGDIRNPSLPPRYFVQLGEAIANARVYGRVAWSHLDGVPQPEIVSEIADRLAQIEGVTWSFCTATHGDRLLLSLRSNRKDAQCGRLLRRVFAQDGSAGGHEHMAAGSMPLEGMDPAERESRRHGLVRRLLQRLDPRLRDADSPPELISRSLAEIVREADLPTPRPPA
jgi:nanoRNase/pAp phosphatase (c-di-AMP/oligoRNAs hydrolase)